MVHSDPGRGSETAIVRHHRWNSACTKVYGSMRGFVVFGAIMIAACTAQDREHREDRADALGVTSEAIVDGTSSPASQDSAVLVSDTGTEVCTGVLVAPNLVLTARHCVTTYDDSTECGGPLGQDRPPTVLAISVGATATAGSPVAHGARLFTPDGATQLCGADIALIMLDNDVKNVTPATLRFTGPSVNELGTAVGYGDEGSSRAQRTGVKTLALGPSTSSYTTESGQPIAMDLSAAEVATSESTCYGDSGGPLFDANDLVMAIASRGPDNGCKDRPTFWTTFAGHADLIKEASTAAGHPISTSTAPTGPTIAGTSSVDGGTGAKRDGESDPLASGGCSTTPGERGGGAIAALLFGVALATRARRRR